MPPKAIIFDIGRVIVRINPKRAFEPFSGGRDTHGAMPVSKTRPSTEQLWTDIQTDSRWRDWQEGRMTPRDWHEHVTGRLRIPLGFAEFCAAWNRVLEPGTILPDELFARLGAHYQLALLSNTDPLHSAHLEEQFSFMSYFPVRIYSCGIGASKPSPAIYQSALDALDRSPAEAIYIDDIEEFAEAARKLGLDAIRFESPAQLTAALVSRGVRPS